MENTMKQASMTRQHLLTEKSYPWGQIYEYEEKYVVKLTGSRDKWGKWEIPSLLIPLVSASSVYFSSFTIGSLFIAAGIIGVFMPLITFICNGAEREVHFIRDNLTINIFKDDMRSNTVQLVRKIQNISKLSRRELRNMKHLVFELDKDFIAYQKKLGKEKAVIQEAYRSGELTDVVNEKHAHWHNEVKKKEETFALYGLEP